MTLESLWGWRLSFDFVVGRFLTAAAGLTLQRECLNGSGVWEVHRFPMTTLQ
jgi:hypothetical protein